MLQPPINTSILSYGKRSPADQQAGMQPVAQSLFNSSSPDNNAERAFRDDASAIAQSLAFRKLSQHTMLAPSTSHHFENRSSHSDNVSDVGIKIADQLGLDSASKALISAIAKGHDAGHPPFSHEGEDAIRKRLNKHGITWNHDNASLQRLLETEQHGMGYRGLPLTVATIEGLAKRHWRFEDHLQKETIFAKDYQQLPHSIKEIDGKHNLNLPKWNHAEGQITSTADWIAVTVTDIKDMMTMKLSEENPAKATKEFFDELKKHFPLARQIAEEVKTEFTSIMQTITNEQRHALPRDIQSRVPIMVKEFGNKLEKALIDDVVKNTQQTLQTLGKKIRYADDIRGLENMLITPSHEMQAQLNDLKKFYYTKIYNSIREAHIDQEKMVGIVFDNFESGKVKMPEVWAQAFTAIEKNPKLTKDDKSREKAMLVTDYICTNMADRDINHHIKKYNEKEAREIFSKAKRAPRPTAQRTKTPDSICDELRTLQSAHRLGMHIWERHTPDQMPNECLKALNEVPADEITNPDRAAKMPFLSMTLLPAAIAGGISVRPYTAKAGLAITMGYLCDLSQDRPDRVIIPRIHELAIYSGFDNKNKQFRLDGIKDSRILEIAATANQDKDDLISHACTQKGAALAARQLDGLGRAMLEEREILKDDRDLSGDIVSTNELLVGAAQKHIKAIMINVYPNDRTIASREYSALVKLHGAIAGLSHLEQGIDLPVVYYHTSPPHQGECTWLGQGQKDLRQKAVEAIRTLQEFHPENTSQHILANQLDRLSCSTLTTEMIADSNKNYVHKITQLTGIDINKPVDRQLRAAELLRIRAVSAASSNAK